jgi:hypothetical protein
MSPAEIALSPRHSAHPVGIASCRRKESLMRILATGEKFSRKFLGDDDSLRPEAP